MKATKLNPPKRDEQSSRCRSSQVLNSARETNSRVVFCVSKVKTTHVHVFLDSFSPRAYCS